MSLFPRRKTTRPRPAAPAKRSGGESSRADAARASIMAPDGYFARSKRPLQILAFLLPLIILYEIGLAVFLRSESGTVTNVAHRTLLRLFSAVGVPISSGLFIGGIVIVVVLLVWHLLDRGPWRVDGRGLLLMAGESILLAIPLLLVDQVAGALFHSGGGVAAAGLPATDWASLDVPTKMTISVGAGLYEELLFRMVLIAILHTILVDIGKASGRLGTTVAVVVAAAAFTLYHPLGDNGDPTRIVPSKVVFYFVAGLWFGLVYVTRGFGIVVAAHAFYDLMTVALNELASDL